MLTLHLQPNHPPSLQLSLLETNGENDLGIVYKKIGGCYTVHAQWALPPMQPVLKSESIRIKPPKGARVRRTRVLIASPTAMPVTRLPIQTSARSLLAMLSVWSKLALALG